MVELGLCVNSTLHCWGNGYGVWEIYLQGYGRIHFVGNIIWKELDEKRFGRTLSRAFGRVFRRSYQILGVTSSTKYIQELTFYFG